MRTYTPPAALLPALALALLLTALPAPARAAPSLDEMAGQMLMVGFMGMTVEEADAIARDVAAGRVGGVVLFDVDMTTPARGPKNIESPEQVRALTSGLQALAPTPLFIAVDQEGGRVMRLKPDYGFPDAPSQREMAEQGPPNTRREAEKIGRTLADVGVNLDLAPVVDVNLNPKSPAIGALGRAFSTCPYTTSKNAVAYVQGLHAAGAVPCREHFPGHGSARADSHKGLTDVTDTWMELELIPYEKLLARGLVDMVMSAHVYNAHLDPEHPASLSRAVITGLLREQLGYDGVVATDDLQMRAITDHYSFEQTVRLAVTAGADILLFGNNLAYDPDIPAKAVATIRGMVDDGSVDAARIRRSYERIMALKARLGE